MHAYVCVWISGLVCRRASEPLTWPQSRWMMRMRMRAATTAPQRRHPARGRAPTSPRACLARRSASPTTSHSVCRGALAPGKTTGLSVQAMPTCFQLCGCRPGPPDEQTPHWHVHPAGSAGVRTKGALTQGLSIPGGSRGGVQSCSLSCQRRQQQQQQQQPPSGSSRRTTDTRCVVHSPGLAGWCRGVQPARQAWMACPTRDSQRARSAQRCSAACRACAT